MEYEIMVSIHVTTRAGEERTISAPAGGVLMEVLRDNGVDGVEAMCGGCCSCATCHVQIDPAKVGDLPPMSHDEKLLLSGLLTAAAGSRLSCQIPFVDSMDGLRLTIPAEE